MTHSCPTRRSSDLIAGTAGLTKTGNGILHLTGANTFSGGITFTGQLWADADASLGALGHNLITTTNATLRIDSGTTNRTIGIAVGTTLLLLGPGTVPACYSTEERRVGKECISTRRSLRAPQHIHNHHT